jgi:hypothetical protein
MIPSTTTSRSPNAVARKRVPGAAHKENSHGKLLRNKLDEFAQGKISRARASRNPHGRRYDDGATITVTSASAAQASDPALKIQLVNHIFLQLPGVQEGRGLVFQGVSTWSR